jgi:hypothetical protein
MTTENQELENKLDENVTREEAPKTLAAFRQRLDERRREEDEDTEITIKQKDGKSKDKDDDDNGDDDDEKKDKKKGKGSFFGKKNGNGNGDDEEEPKKKFFSPKGGDVNEETTAASTLHPGAKGGDKLNMSRVEMMKHMVTHMAGLNKTDFTEWFKKSLDRWGPNKDHGVPDVSGKNQASIDSKFGSGPKTKDPMPKLHVREDLNEILGDTQLSEEVLEKTAVLFEAAVHARCVMETVRIEEEYVELLTEEINHFTSTTTEKLDNYFDYVVENWMSENQIAVDSALRTEITCDFIEGLKGLFGEHYIDVPESKVDVLEAMADKVEVLEARLEDIVSENALLKDAIIGGAKQEVIEHVGKDLTQAEREKFATLAEGIDFEGDFDDYTNKLAIVKENYFSGTVKKQAPQSNILEESFEGEEENKSTGYVDPAVNRYADAIARTVKGNMAAQG